MSESRHHHLPGEVIARHRHDGEHQLLYVSSGVLAVSTEYGTWVAGAQRAIWTPAVCWHEHRVHGHVQVHLLRFPAQESLFPGDRPTVIAVSPLLRELLMACTEPGLPPAEARRLRAVVRDRVRRADLAPLTLPAARDARLAHACRLVTDDLARPRTIPWLARQVGTSDRQLTRLFRAEFACTYPQWRTNVRVFHAMLELSAGTSVTTTAHRCGWATASAFVDAFARTTGQTPGAYQAGERAGQA
ncbi:AraC family transcriptional regulator [Lentzea guizhouensis]|uniref:AraC family transcriptional regulator n=1 Tax=Lentzea guizhouensis TaxID=1586287 RepID=A0A1B2HRE9_9PSEU|nr:helix-turn-helix transcriptional regulator [Lentzea guizhouensis]ANZ40288.1 AraC family transcriptional regulator [Lentzea guizhouensis]